MVVYGERLRWLPIGVQIQSGHQANEFECLPDRRTDDDFQFPIADSLIARLIRMWDFRASVLSLVIQVFACGLEKPLVELAD